jgi:hypothetical protein
MDEYVALPDSSAPESGHKRRLETPLAPTLLISQLIRMAIDDSKALLALER